MSHRPVSAYLRTTLLAGVSASALAFGAGSMAAAAPQGPRITAEKTVGFKRIAFRWPQDVAISARVDGPRLAITFDRKGSYDFSALKEALGDTIQSADLAQGGRTVILVLDKPYRVRTFTSDRMAGVDLMEPLPQQAADDAKGDAEEGATLQPEIPEEPESLPAAPAKKTAKTAKAPAKPVAKKDPKDYEVYSTYSSAPVIKPAAPTPKAAKQVAEAKTMKALPVEKVYSTTPPAEPYEDLTKLSPSAGPEPEMPQPIAEQPGVKTLVPPVKASAKPAEDEPENVLSIVPAVSSEGGVLRFTFPERTASAIFRRSGHLWLVFSRPAEVNLQLLDNQLPNQTGPAERIPHPSATIIRIPFDGQAGATITKDDAQFAWQIALFNRPQITANSLQINVNTEPPLKPHLLIPALEVSEPMTIKDPTIGDTLIVTPFYTAGDGVAPGRNFVDFSVLESMQGLVVQKIADDTSVALLRNGIRVSTPRGAQLSPNLPKPETPPPAEDSASLTLFPYEKWHLPPGEQFDREIRHLFTEMALAKTAQEKTQSRLRIIQLYLGQGMGTEAVAMLQIIRATDPSYYISNKLNALSGVANFLMYRFGEAAQDFASLELNGNAEVAFWRNLIAEMLGAADKRFDFMAVYPTYISKYPPVLRQRLAILGADRMIAAKEYTTALKIMDTLDSPEILDPVKPYANFLLGKISAGTGQADAATEVWRELSEDYSNPFVRASAEFSLVVQQLQAGTMNKDEVIKRLERLRIAWRGDGLELGVLQFLGNLYAEKGEYALALDAWRDIVSVFPNTQQATDVSRRMKDAFVTLFNKGVSDKLPLLDALALYYEYRDLTPSGKEGDEIIHKLADKLVAVDLLDQATLLLEQQMRTRQEKIDRSRTGSKLALVHLLNHQPEKALQVLEQSNYGDNPDDLRALRDRLTAQALADTHHYDQALALLERDTSLDADRIRLQVYWNKKDWPNLITAAESSLKKRNDPTAPITPAEADSLLKLALAYIFERDTVQLHYLQDYFGPLLAEGAQKDIFNFLTQENLLPNPTNFEQAMQQVDSTRSFLESYRTRIREENSPKS